MLVVACSDCPSSIVSLSPTKIRLGFEMLFSLTNFDNDVWCWPAISERVSPCCTVTVLALAGVARMPPNEIPPKTAKIYVNFLLNKIKFPLFLFSYFYLY